MTEHHDPGAGEEDQRKSFPGPRDLLAALGLLTILPLPRPEPDSEAFGRAALYFPLAGLLVGALLAGVDWLLGNQLPPWMLGAVLVAVWELANRSPLSARSRGGTRITALSATGMAVVVLTKIVCLSTVSGTQPLTLLFAPLFGRWAIVVLATGARDARAPGRKFNSAITFREFALTSVFTLAVVFSVAEALGILIAVCVAGVILAMRLLAHRWFNGVTWRLLLAAAAAVEAFVVALSALL